VAKPYEKMAEAYSDAVFLKLYGNANPACKALFKQFKIRSTPSFLYFRHGGCFGFRGLQFCRFRGLEQQQQQQ
jgi:hypothetical protein